LSISRQIAEAHGGSLKAENMMDAGGKVTGARFILSLPVETNT
jgi:two-component system sensor histidine kinase ChvG